MQENICIIVEMKCFWQDNRWEIRRDEETDRVHIRFINTKCAINQADLQMASGKKYKIYYRQRVNILNS